MAARDEIETSAVLIGVYPDDLVAKASLPAVAVEFSAVVTDRTADKDVTIYHYRVPRILAEAFELKAQDQLRKMKYKVGFSSASSRSAALPKLKAFSGVTVGGETDQPENFVVVCYVPIRLKRDFKYLVEQLGADAEYDPCPCPM